MKPTRAEFKLSTGYIALFADRIVAEDSENDGPFLLLPVTNYDEATETLETLERSRARKRKESPAAATAAPGAPPGVAARGQEVPRPSPPLRCVAPDCIFDVDVGDCCRDHGTATEEQKAEWRKARAEAEKPTPPAEAKRRTRKILDGLGGAKPEQGAAAEPGKVA